MVKNVIELLDEIAKGNLDKLPKKIMIDNTILEKDEQFETYFTKDYGVGLMSFLSGTNTLIEYLKFPVKEVKEKWKPEEGETYYYIDDFGKIDKDTWEGTFTDSYRYNIVNCFKTEKEAQNHLDNINTEIELRKLAEELNNGEEINWNNAKQGKNYFYYDYEDDCIYSGKESTEKNAKTIYCLDYEFRERAIEKIGEEKLKNYLMEE